MSIFNVITLFGGLAMFLYGMRLMGNGLKEGSSGTLKQIMEHVTNNSFKAFLLGLGVTALIQSSTATIVITSGLVAAGILTLHQSLGIIVGANVGTTVTGQIIRLLDVDGGNSWLQVFKPSTLAPIALIIGIILIMFVHFNNSETIGSIAMGFGILFSGLLNMTGAVSALSDSGVFNALFSGLGNNPFLGYVTGAGVAFILQSSSATIGILQAFAMTGQLTFKAIYAVVVGIYLGDCVTTAIVCSIGAKAEPRRVGIVNILFNLSETVLVFLFVTVLHAFGILDGFWAAPISSGGIANTNTVFNLGCSILLFPLLGTYEKLARKIVKDEPVPANPYAEKLEAMSPVFFSTPALALRSVYDVLMLMYRASRMNFSRAVGLVSLYDEKVMAEIRTEEDRIDDMADKVSKYLVQLSPHLSAELHVQILNHYYKAVSEFERLGDRAMKIAETASDLNQKDLHFSDLALNELAVLVTLLGRTLHYAERAFRRRDVEAADRIEPMEQVVDDLTEVLKENHLDRMRRGVCNVYEDNDYLNLLMELSMVSDICSNIGMATVIRANPELAGKSHDYIVRLHDGTDESFNKTYSKVHDEYFAMLQECR